MIRKHEQIKNTKRKSLVFVGLSGGVDSAVSTSLLLEAGYEVVGVFIKTWHPDFLACNEEEERRDAMRVAARLGIPFLTFDLEEVYKKEVADYMIREYKAGRTPNPDVMCNKEVKFGAFLQKVFSMGADFIATGHYAQTKKKLSSHFLMKGADPTKDQSYFLWTLTQEQLSKIIFPIGHLKKSKVRALAKRLKLPVAEKKDSQGICFLGAVNLKEFLKHYIKSKKGKVFDEKGEEIGHHDGVVFYTLGERHGFAITKKTPTDGAYYVIGKDIEKNILYVSQNKNAFFEKFSYREDSMLDLKETNWISAFPKPGIKYKAQIRYHGYLSTCEVDIISKTGAKVFFERSILVASGQSCVIYDGDICLGGGVVK